MKPGMPSPSTIATMYKGVSKEISEQIHFSAQQFEEICKRIGEEDSDNPYKNAEAPHKVLAVHGDNFHAAANSVNRHAIMTHI